MSEVRKFFGALILFSIIFLGLTASPIYSQLSFYLSPLLVPLELAPGAKVSVSFMLINESTTKPAQFKVYATDVLEQRSGAYKPTEKGTSPWSAAGWIRIEGPSQFEIGPGEAKEIAATVSVPRGVFGGRYATVVFELIPEEAPPGERLGGTVFQYRLASVIEITISGRRATRKAHISLLEVRSARENPTYRERFGEEALIFISSLTNEGNIHVFGQGTLIIRDKTGRRLMEIPLGGGRGTVIPEATVNFVSVLRRRLTPGEYIAEARIKYGGIRPAVAKAPFTITAKELTAGKPGTGKVINFIAEPELIDLKGVGGAFRSSRIIVSSQVEIPIKVKSSVRMLSLDAEGEVESIDMIEGPWSCAKWVTLEPEEFELASGEKKTVRLTVKIPPDLSGGRYASIIFEAQATGRPGETVRAVAETGSILMVSVGKDFQLEGEIVKMQPGVSPDTGGPAIITTFKNKGNIHVTLTGMIVLKKKTLLEVTPTEGMEYVGEPRYEEVSRINFEEVSNVVLPDGIRDLRIALPANLTSGEYLAEAMVNYGGKRAAVSSFTFTVEPPPATPGPKAEESKGVTPEGNPAGKRKVSSGK